MSSEDEDIDLNDEVASQVDTITDDGGDIVDMDGIICLLFITP